APGGAVRQAFPHPFAQPLAALAGAQARPPRGEGRAADGAVLSRPGRDPTGDRAMARPRLLSGGNPQIPKGEGEAPVRAYLDALPGWKQPLGRRIDALVEQACPGVRRAVKWNSPFYGAPGATGWFLSFHAYERYLKLAFFE